MMVVKAVRYFDHPAFQINGLNLAREEFDSFEQLAHGIHDVREIKIAGCHFVEHGREKEEVLAVYQGDLDIWVAGQRFIQVNRGMQSGEAAAKNDDSSFNWLTHADSTIVGLAFPSSLSRCGGNRRWIYHKGR